MNFVVSLSVTTDGHFTLQLVRKRGFVYKQRQKEKKNPEFICRRKWREGQEEEKWKQQLTFHFRIT